MSKKKMGKLDNKVSKIHRIHNDFMNKFQKYRPKKTKYEPDHHGYVWRWIGYDLMERVKKWAKKHRKHVEIVHCDDDLFASSDLVIIQNKWRKEYFGTTVIYIPQCTTELPIKFFLYPHHQRNLIKALQKIKLGDEDMFDEPDHYETGL